METAGKVNGQLDGNQAYFGAYACACVCVCMAYTGGWPLWAGCQPHVVLVAVQQNTVDGSFYLGISKIHTNFEKPILPTPL